MILLDMRTIIFSYMLTTIVCMVVIVLLWRQTRNRFAGTTFLVFDFVFQTIALFLIILRGSIPDWMSMVLANTLVVSGAFLGYIGLTGFVGKKSSQIHNYIFLVLFACVHIYFTFITPDLAVRNFNISIGLLVMVFQCAWLMLYRVGPHMRPLTRGTGIVFAIYCPISVVRIIDFFFADHALADYFHSGIFESLIMSVYQLLFILLAYSLFLMFNKRLLLDVVTQEEKFSKAFHLSPYAITITRLSDGQIIEVNDGFMSITGYQLADLSEKTTYALHLWDRNEDRVLVAEELTSKGGVRNREFQFRIKSGERVTGLFSAEIILINNEKCVLSTIIDITGRKRTEEEIKEKATEVERFNRLMIGRELQMVELKKEINELSKRLGEEEKYRIIEKGSSA